MNAFDGIPHGAAYVHAVENLHLVECKICIPDLRVRHVRVWREMAQLDPFVVNR